jgi:pimeloyl-ACP methyl ester carboxylesterase
VERPGVGDSEGPPCADNDLRTDMATYRAALRALKKYDFVDADNVFLFGSSLGGALAPIIAHDEPVRGLIVSGAFTKTWYEHMLEIERTRLALLGRTPSEINEAMRGYSEFYSLYLNQKLTPAEVIRQRPQLAKLWDDEPERQYGRPAAFYHQVQELNVEAAWAQISVPALIIYGEYDWIMSRADHELAAHIVNRRRPGSARLVIAPKTSHSLDVYESMEKAFKEEGGKFDDSMITLIIDWLKDHHNTGK